MKKEILAFLLLILGFLLLSPTAEAQAGGTGPNYEVRLTDLEEELRALNGRIEQIEFTVRRLDQTLQRLQTDMDARLTKLEFAAPPPASAPAVIAPPAPPPAQPKSSQVEPNPNGTLGAIKMQDGRVTGAVNNPQATPLPETPADYGLNAQEQYDRAFGLLRQASYDEAEKAFKQFIDKNPKDKLIDNAKYWYGETLYVRGKFGEAAVAFAEAYQQNARGSKAPDSLLKLAMSLEGLDKTADACTTLGELKAKYPNASSSLKSRAEEERTKLKCTK